MMIFIYGEDTFSSRRKLKEIISHYKEVNKKGLALEYLDLDERSFPDLKNGLQQNSIFNEKKLLILTNFFSNAQFKEEFIEKGKDLDLEENVVVFFQNGKADARDKLFKYLKKEAKSQEFSPLEGEKLKVWLREEFSNLGVEVGDAVLNQLVESVGPDLWRMENEIKKLVSFAGKKTIKPEDVDLLVDIKSEADIFETIDAIAQKDRKKAMILVHRHLEKGDSPVYLLHMINYQFRNLLIVKDLAEKNYPYYYASKATGMKPFVLRKSWELAQKFTLLELKKIYQKIFQADFSIKTGKAKPETAIDSLLCEI